MSVAIWESVEQLQHPDPAVRHEAAVLLGQEDVQDPAVIESMVRLLRDSDGDVRAAARRALGRIGAAQATRLRPGPVLVALKKGIFGVLAVIQVLFALLMLLGMLLKLLLEFGGR